MKKHVLLNKAGYMLGLFFLLFIMMYSCKEDTVKPTDDSPDINNDANHEDVMLHEFVYNTTKKSGTNERFSPEYNDLTANQTIRFVEAAINYEFGNPQLDLTVGKIYCRQEK